MKGASHCEPNAPQARFRPQVLEDRTGLGEELLRLVAVARLEPVLSVLEQRQADPVGHLELAKTSCRDLEAVPDRLASTSGKLGGEASCLRVEQRTALTEPDIRGRREQRLDALDVLELERRL